MTSSDTLGRFPALLAGLLALLASVVATTGCDPSSPRRLQVATTWPRTERVRLESDFHKWASSRLDAGHEPIDLEWLILAPGDDLALVMRRRNPPDVLLGARAGVLDRLAGAERLIPVEDGGSAPWCVVRRAATGLADGPSPPHREHENTALGDPRTDPITLAWAIRQLEPGRWGKGYARLVQLAGHEPRIGWHGGGEPGGQAGPDGEIPHVPPWVLGAGISRSARDPGMAREFFQFLIETREVELAPDRSIQDDEPDPDVESLVADLLGAALVDAQDELWAAWGALERAGDPEPARTWLTEPPHWPPASIEKYARREGANAMSLIETLAAEIAPEPAVRGWLIRSWLAPPRLVDLALLAELAHAADGRLSHEPRFRSWLRAEWTASARQRYRRVARLAATTQPRSVSR